MSTIVCLSGLPLPSSIFDQAAAQLGSVHTVHQLDYAGFAGRELPPKLDFDGYVRLVRDEIAALREPAVVCGVSFGAQIGLRLAETAPDLVAGLVLSNTPGSAPNDQEAGMFHQAADAAEAHGAGALVEMLTGMLLSEETRRSRPEVVARFGELITAQSGPAVASAFRALAGRPDPANVLPGVGVPVLLAFGPGDGAVPIGEADVLAAGLSRATAHPIEGAGHLPPLEAPAAYASAVELFLAAAPATA